MIEKKPKFTKEEFLKYQNSKFRNRRYMAIATAMGYFGIIIYMLWKIPPEHFDQYDNFFMMVTSFATGIVVSYYGGSSYTETRTNSQDLLDEFTTFHNQNEDSRQRRDYQRRQKQYSRQQPEQFDNNQEVPGNPPDPAQQQNDNEVG